MKVFVTGISAIVGCNACIEDVWNSHMSETEIDAKSLTRLDLMRLSGLHDDDGLILADYQIMALACVNIAWKNAGLSNKRNRLRGTENRVSDCNIACVGGSALGNLVAFTMDMDKNFSPYPHYSVSRWRGNAATAVVAQVFGLAGPSYSINAASATGGQSIVLAANMIKHGIVDCVIVFCVEPMIQGPVLDALTNTGALTVNGAPPLTENRSGMRPLSGAGCIILESEKRIDNRNACILAEWINGVSGTEIFHLISPDPDGERLQQLLELLFNKDNKNLKPSDVDWLSLHATGTVKFDPIELATIRRFFEPHRPWISAFKRVNGHLLGASGIIEFALLTHGLANKILPPWPRLTDPKLNFDNLRPLDVPIPRKALMINQGMGGSIAVNLLGQGKK